MTWLRIVAVGLGRVSFGAFLAYPNHEFALAIKIAAASAPINTVWMALRTGAAPRSRSPRVRTPTVEHDVEYSQPADEDLIIRIGVRPQWLVSTRWLDRRHLRCLGSLWHDNLTLSRSSADASRSSRSCAPRKRPSWPRIFRSGRATSWRVRKLARASCAPPSPGSKTRRGRECSPDWPPVLRDLKPE